MIMPKRIPTEQLEKADGGDSLMQNARTKEQQDAGQKAVSDKNEYQASMEQKHKKAMGMAATDTSRGGGRDHIRQARRTAGHINRLQSEHRKIKSQVDHLDRVDGHLRGRLGLMEKLEKWQPKHKVATARNRKAREGYMNIGHHTGRQNLAHGVVEQMEKGDIPMNTEEQQRLNKAVVQLEKIAGLGAVSGAAKKAAGAVSGAAKKVTGGGDSPTPKTPNFYETANVSRGKGATSRDWQVQRTPAIDTSPYGKERERVRTDVTEEQRAKRTGEPMRAKPQGAKQSGGSRLARAFGATKRAAKEFGQGFKEGGPVRRSSQQMPSAAQRNRSSRNRANAAGDSAANPYGDAASRDKYAANQKFASLKPGAPKIDPAAKFRESQKMEKAVVSLQKYVDNCGCD